MRQVRILTTLSESTIRRLIGKKLFPEPNHLTPDRRISFFADEVDDWIANRPPFDEPPSPSKAASGKKKRPPPRK